MIKIFIFIIICTFINKYLSLEYNSSDWELIFEDNFDGNSLNETVWNIKNLGISLLPIRIINIYERQYNCRKWRAKYCYKRVRCTN